MGWFTNIQIDWKKLYNMENSVDFFGRVTGGILLVVAGLLAVHVVLEIAEMLPSFFNAARSVYLKPVVIDILTIAIMVELAELFIKINVTHKLSVNLLLDMGIVFSIREIIVELYAEHPSTFIVSGPEVALIIMVVLRFLIHAQKERAKKFKMAQGV